jgi:hypothetical protein
MLDVALSLAIAKEIRATTKECFYHALRAFFAAEKLQSGWYVEGFAIPDTVTPRATFEHGWIKRDDGSIIDPSWVLLGNKKVDYFPGVSYTYTHVSTLVQGKKGVLLPLISQKHTDPFDHPAYFQAFKKSFQATTGFPPTEQDRLFMISLRTGLQPQCRL